MEKQYVHPTDAIACADRMLSILSRSLYTADAVELDADEIEATIKTVQEKLGVALEGLGFRWRNGRIEALEQAPAEGALRAPAGTDARPREHAKPTAAMVKPSKRSRARKGGRAAR